MAARETLTKEGLNANKAGRTCLRPANQPEAR